MSKFTKLVFGVGGAVLGLGIYRSVRKQQISAAKNQVVEPIEIVTAEPDKV